MSMRIGLGLLVCGLASASACGDAPSDENESWAGTPTPHRPTYDASHFGAYEEATPGEACEQVGDAGLCGDEGVTFCDAMADDTDLQWGPCLPMYSVECVPGSTVRSCDWGSITCLLYGGVPGPDEEAECFDNPSGETVTPLVLRFDDRPIEMQAMSSIGFEMDASAPCDNFDWPSPVTPWLVLDRDQNGSIENGSELFGSGTRLKDGSLARNGFEALRELDSNDDGLISPLDARWSELGTWADADADRRGSGLELASSDEAGLVRIELEYAVERLCDARGNCGVERAAFVFRDETGREREGEVVDLHLSCQ